MEYIAILFGESMEEAQEYLSYNSYYFRSGKPKFITTYGENTFIFRVDLVGSWLADVTLVTVEPIDKRNVDIRRY